MNETIAAFTWLVFGEHIMFAGSFVIATCLILLLVDSVRHMLKE